MFVKLLLYNYLAVCLIVVLSGCSCESPRIHPHICTFFHSTQTTSGRPCPLLLYTHSLNTVHVCVEETQDTPCLLSKRLLTPEYPPHGNGHLGKLLQQNQSSQVTLHSTRDQREVAVLWATEVVARSTSAALLVFTQLVTSN